MCGRFTLTSDSELLARQFELSSDAMPPGSALAPRYNIAPTQPVAAVRMDVEGQPEGRRMDFLHWGLVPFWAKEPGIGNRMINARSETAAEKPAFRAAYKRRRCLVPASGFYEWVKADDGGKQPHYIQLKDEAPIGIAGLWERWSAPDGSELESCTLLTCEANELMAPLHHRMPVILEPRDYGLWLDPEVQQAELIQPLLRPYDPERMTHHMVSRHVNAPKNDDPECVVPIEG